MDTPQRAFELARSGDLSGARALLDRLATAHPARADSWLARALIERDARDDAAEIAALDEALRREPRNLLALLTRGDAERRRGDERAASRFYSAALASAQSGAPPHLRAPLEEAQRFLAASQQRFGETLTKALDQVVSGRGSLPRVDQAIDLLTGKRELYLQQPSMFYFPELAQRAFFERSEFAWAAEVEAATDAIRDELLAVLQNRSDFTPYIQSEPNAPRPDHHLLDDANWGAFHLFEKGRPHPANAARCPQTIAALAHAPMPQIGTRSPMALFSRLTPGTHIAPHHGVFNTRLICHLPLIVPPDCAIRVGAETREWREGELLIFDDSIEHEAWNRSDTERVVLIFEVWRPDIDPAERAAITALLASIEQHGMLAGVAD